MTRTEKAQSAPPVFLVGAARSGTSLLYKALCLHPEAGWISNWVRRAPGIPALAALNRIAARAPALRRRVWFGEDSNAYVYGAPRAFTERLFPMPVEGEPVYRRCGIPERAEDPAARVEEQIARLQTSFEAILRASGGRRLVSKRIANNRRIPLLASAFPAALYVEIVRDGRAVAYSLSRVNWWKTDVVWWYGGTPTQWAAEGRDPWEICARNWVEELGEVERGLGEIPAARVLRVRYESFVRQPLSTLEQVRGFLGLSPDEGWRRELERLRFPDRNEAWRDRLSSDTIERIVAWQGPDLRRLGYLEGGDGSAPTRQPQPARGAPETTADVTGRG